jgi:hypothetical protein
LLLFVDLAQLALLLPFFPLTRRSWSFQLVCCVVQLSLQNMYEGRHIGEQFVMGDGLLLWTQFFATLSLSLRLLGDLFLVFFR